MTRIMPALLFGLTLSGALTACGEEDKKLKVTNIEPETGDASGGTYVSIRGNRFLADGPRNAKIWFGTTQGAIIQFQSDRELIVRAPAGEIGKQVDVLLVFEPGGEIRIKNAFKFIEKKKGGPTMDDLTPKK